MATRFLAIITDGFGESTIPCPPDMRITFEALGLSVFATETADSLDVREGQGTVIGHLFTRSDQPERLKTIKRATADSIDEFKTRLITCHWGGYVAFLRDSGTRSITVFRDPSGEMPCYYLKSGQSLILSSDVETLFRLGLLKPEIDWQGLARQLQCHDLRSPKTCLRDVTELSAGGELVVRSQEIVAGACWSPWDYVKPSPPTDHDAGPQHLRALIVGSLSARAKAFKHILLGVSGGLDSSIIAAVLARSGTPLTCFTMATHEPEGDERYYARLLCETLEVPLVEAFHALAQIDITRSVSAHLPRPLGHAFGQSLEHTLSDLAQSRGADALFTGQGGDNIFCFMQSATPIVDRWKAQGFGPGLWRTTLDICEMTGCTVWEAGRLAIQRALNSDPAYRWSGSRRFLNKDLLEQDPIPLMHPWLKAPPGALPGKAVHISLLLRILGTLEHSTRFGPTSLVTPLLSQPIVEYCLGIPTWEWCADGQNRAPARLAFSEDLPPQIINRQTKGGAFSFLLDVLDARKAQMRHHVLGGLLAQNRIIDVETLDGIFSGKRPMLETDYLRLSRLSEAESWARAWDVKSRNGGSASQTVVSENGPARVRAAGPPR